MATSNRTITLVFTGPPAGTQTIAGAENTAAPNSIEIKTLSSGANTITVPTGGATVTACTIVPPAGNTTNLTLKGVTGDTGVQLHDTDPSSISLDAATTSFCLTAAGTITGVRLYWS